jgi:DNA polymerase-1
MFNCTDIYSVWDKRLIRGIKNYRRQAKQVEYKGNRDEKKNTHVFSYEDKTTELLTKLGVKNMYPGILEADDVISWLSNKIKHTKVIVSVDQDMLQLVNDTTFVYSPIKDVIIDKNNFEEKTGVPVDQFLRYKSLMGDKSDNLPGLDKCGPKTAKKLVTKYPDDVTLEQALGADKLKPYYTNLDLIDLKQGEVHHPEDCKLYQEQHAELESHEPDFPGFSNICESLNMNKIVEKLDDWKTAFSNVNINDRLENIVNSLNLTK